MTAQALRKTGGISAKNGFTFTDADFNHLRRLIGEHTGISLSDSKRDLVYGRLSKRLRLHGLDRFRDYRRLLDVEDSEELEHFTNALTTNLTAFFREEHHFEHVQKVALPALMDKARKGGRVRIWSAGCSTGEEPYSIAIAIAEAMPNHENQDIRILATDLDTNVVKHAAEGIYTESRIEGLSKTRRNRWFKKGSGRYQGHVKVSDTLRNLVTFRPLNLMHPWPMKGPFDIIFCRNVVIYFDKSTQRALFERYANILDPDAYLYIGHSETLHKVSDRFDLIGKTIYRKTK